MHSLKLSKAFSLVPADLWFEIIDHLAIIDIVHLRAVSRNFYRIVSSPVVWKRLLRKVRIPLPYQPRPIRTLSAKATESIIERAILLDINWQRMTPHASTRVLSSNERPYMVRMMPGGRYLVAATKSSEDASFAVCVWDLENPEEYGGGCALLAKCRTRTAVSALVAKYMVHKGNQGIAIATLRSIGEKPATKTEVCVVHISLAILDKLCKDEDLGDQLPFQLVELHKARCQIAYMNLEGNVLSVVHRPRTLMLFNLETKKQSQLKLQNPQDGHRHSIQGCKMIPFQNQVLIIRLIYAEDHTSYAFEIYALPEWDCIVKEPLPLQHQVFEEVAASSFSISDIIVRQPNSDHPTEADKFKNCHYAAPISIFANTMRPKGIIHWQITPRLLPANAIDGMNTGLPQPGNPAPGMISHNPAFPAPPPVQSPPVSQAPAAPGPGLALTNLISAAVPLHAPFPQQGAFMNPFGFMPNLPAPGGAPMMPFGNMGNLNPMQLLNQLPPIIGPPFQPVPPGGYPNPVLNGPAPVIPPPPVHAPPPPLPDADMDLPMTTGEDGEDLGPLVPVYSLPCTRLAHYWFEENDQKPAVSSGADRSVFWTRPLENRADYPPMRNLLGYSSKAPKIPPNVPISHVISHFLRTIGEEEDDVDLYAGINSRPIGPPSLSDAHAAVSSHPDFNNMTLQNGLAANDGWTAGPGNGVWQGGPVGGGNPDVATSGPDDRRLKQLSLPGEFVEAVQQGTQGVSFDETSGKLVIIAGKPTKLYLLDYAWA